MLQWLQRNHGVGSEITGSVLLIIFRDYNLVVWEYVIIFAFVNQLNHGVGSNDHWFMDHGVGSNDHFSR